MIHNFTDLFRRKNTTIDNNLLKSSCSKTIGKLKKSTNSKNENIDSDDDFKCNLPEMIFCDNKIEKFINNCNFLTEKYTINKIIKLTSKAILVVSKDNKEYVAKIRKNYNSIRNNTSDQEKKVFDILVNKNSDKISKYYEYYECKHYDYIVSIYEYIDGVTLTQYIQNNKITDKFILLILRKVLECLKFIHNNNIVHCDIKPDNIMIAKDDNTVKLIDFDFCIVLTDEFYMSDYIFGTLDYIAPESHDLKMYSKKSDVWSLGVIIYSIITNKYPYNINIYDSCSNLYRWNEFKHPNMTLLKTKIADNNLNEKLYDIIDYMLQFNVNKRYGVEQLLDEINKLDETNDKKVDNISYC